MNFEAEVFFQCPHCMQQISMVFEELYGDQKYIEDCEVCCNPIEILYSIEEGEITLQSVQKAY